MLPAAFIYTKLSPKYDADKTDTGTVPRKLLLLVVFVNACALFYFNLVEFMPSTKKKHGGRHHGRRRRSRKPQSAATAAAQDQKLARAPHNFVFSRPGCGSLVKTLALDLRQVFEPFTASQVYVNRRNVLKDFITIAGPLHVSHILYLNHPRSEKIALKRTRHAANLEKRNNVLLKNEDSKGHESKNISPSPSAGGVYLHIIRVPSGPSLTFRVSEYSLTRDIFTLVQKIFDMRQFSTPPLLAMTGFGSGTTSSAPPPPHLRLLVDIFQNMLPSLNIQKLKVSSVRRVLLLSREVDSCSDGDGGEGREVIYLRHYNIRLENRSLSRALRRLGMGGAPMRRQRKRAEPGGLGPQGFGKSSGVPSLANYTSIDDYLSKASLLTDSAASEVEDMAEVTLPGQPEIVDEDMADMRKPSAGCKVSSKEVREIQAQAKAAHGFTHLSGCRKGCVRLTEIGPRLTLQLIKIEEGVNSGAVLYHSWRRCTPQEIAQQEADLQAKRATKMQRRAEHDKRRRANEATTAASTKVSVKQDDDNTSMMHQLSDGEAVENAVAEEKAESKPKTKKKKKISRKHPAYSYLLQKAQERKLTRLRRR